MHYILEPNLEICLLEEKENKFFFLDLHWKAANFNEDSPLLREKLKFHDSSVPHETPQTRPTRSELNPREAFTLY